MDAVSLNVMWHVLDEWMLAMRVSKLGNSQCKEHPLQSAWG